MDDIAIIIVTHDSALWILPCLQSVFAHLGAIRADVVVADTESTDRTAELVDAEFPARAGRPLSVTAASPTRTIRR